MAFEPQNKLEQSLVKATTDPAHRPQFIRDFIESDIFVIQDMPSTPDKKGHVTLKVGEQVSIRPITYQGKSYIPVFSSLLRLQSVLKAKSGYMQVNVKNLLELTKGAEILLNPESEYGKIFSQAEIGSILDGSIFKPNPNNRYVAEKAVEVSIGQPANYPKELIAVLSRLFERKPQVKRAYLAHFLNPETDKKGHTLIALEVTGDYDSVSAEIGLILKNDDVPIPDPPVDVMQMTGKGGIEDYFLKQVKPFYERKSFKLFR